MNISSEQSQAGAEATLAYIGSKTTYTGAAAASMGWVFSSEFGIAIGVVLGLLGFAINWYYSRKRDGREQTAHDALMKLHANIETEPNARIRQIMRHDIENHD